MHTPGPWRVSGFNNEVEAGDFKFLQTNNKGATLDVWRDNARLIAATPDLLETLRRIAWIADGGRQFNPGTEKVMRDLFVDIRDQARAAIVNGGGL